MNDEHISIEAKYSSNPNKQRTFIVHFFDDHRILTTVTSTPSVARRWVRSVIYFNHICRRRKLVVGLGVQWRASRYTKNQPAATLQLCVGRRCLVFQLLHAQSVPMILRRFLSAKRTTFVGIRNHRHAAMLLSSEHKLSVRRIVDARIVAAKRRGLRLRVSMEELAAEILGFEGVKKPKEVGMSDWDDYWLSREQVQYACVDAFIGFSLGKALRVWDWNDQSEYSEDE